MDGIRLRELHSAPELGTISRNLLLFSRVVARDDMLKTLFITFLSSTCKMMQNHHKMRQAENVGLLVQV